MSNVEPRQRSKARFSLRHLLTVTTLMALGIAVGLAYQKNRSLTQQINDLRSLSGRMPLTNEQELASVSMLNVADDFNTWQVNVPEGQNYELRLGLGAVSEKDIPPIVGSVRLAAGQHRVTFHKGASPSEEFRYVVYVDGLQVIEKTMGRDWIPGGWSSGQGLQWPRVAKPMSAPLQLAGQRYEPKRDFGTNYFNGQSDNYVTRQGYRLWIDQPDCTYQPASPFIGFPGDPQYDGVGLCDGIRVTNSSPSPYQWTFSRPALATTQSVLKIEAEFFASDGTELSSQSPSFESWRIRNAAIGTGSLNWQEEPTQQTQTAFLHATSKLENSLQPVVELQWDVNKPDEVGLRLADTPANESIVRWRLRILEGSHHLWRELQMGNHAWITPNDAMNAGDVSSSGVVLDESSAKPSTRTAKFDLGKDATADIHLRWQTNETLPLQIVERTQKVHAGLGLYKGIPVTLGIQIPGIMKPTLAVDVVDQHPTSNGTPFPGGPVFAEIRIDLEAVKHDWIWLSAKPK